MYKVDNPEMQRIPLLAPTGAAAINIDGIIDGNIDLLCIRNQCWEQNVST